MRTLLVLLAIAGPAWAEAGATDDGAPPRRDAAEVARDGAFLPQTMAARIGDQRVLGMVMAGYDSAPGSQGGTVSAVVEGALYRRVAIRVGVDSLVDAGVNSRTIATVGVRIGLLRQEQQGVDVAVAASYKTQGLTETTGEIELAVLASRRWDHLGLYGNLVYGQGFASAERDGGVRLALLYGLGDHVNLGLDAGCRFDLGDGGPATRVPGELDFDLLAGPVAMVALGPVLLQAQVGPHAVVPDGTNLFATGVAAMAGLGATF